MKLLYSSDDIQRIALLRSALDDAGIAYNLRNETLPYPGAIFCPEVWVVEDSEFVRARALCDTVTKVPAPQQSAWICPGCGENLEGQFSSCWKCGANRNA